jgi:hypothetical protein
MPAPAVSQAELQRVHRALCITVPLDQASPLILAMLSMVARHWRKKGELKNIPQPVHLQHRKTERSADQTSQSIDLKRRAAGDFD